MKRFVAIVTVAVLVFASSAGTAFAYSCTGDRCCSGAACAPTPTPECGPTAVPDCPMTNGGQTARNAGCMHGVQRQPLGATSASADQSFAAVCVSAAPLLGVRLLGPLTRAPFAPDARGAPHLTSVIRI